MSKNYAGPKREADASGVGEGCPPSRSSLVQAPGDCSEQQGHRPWQSPFVPPWTEAHKDREPVLAQLCPSTEGTPSFRGDKSYFQNYYPGERSLEGVNT